MKKKIRLIPWGCLVAITLGFQAFADDGIDAYRHGKYPDAAKLLANDTSKNPIVDYYLGNMRLYGYGQLKNDTEALRYFQQAGDAGYLPAQQFLARYNLIVLNKPEDALYWFKKAADKNDISAQLYCAAAYQFGLGVSVNTDIAKRYYILAAKNGNSIGEYALAEGFIDSRQIENKKLGLIWLNKAVLQNNPAAQAKLGELYMNGVLVGVDLARARELINASIAQGYTPALYQMGLLYLKQNDEKSAKEWFNKAANAHYLPAAFSLAKLHLDPKSSLYHPETGFLTMQQVAQNGYKEAQTALANLYATGNGVEKNDELAKLWQQKATQVKKEPLAHAQVAAAQWLTHGKATNLATSGYELGGILVNWQNKEALKQNIYNQPPRIHELSRQFLYSPKFVMTAPNDVPINEYYDALASTLTGEPSGEALNFPRYPLLPVTTSLTGNDVHETTSPSSHQAIEARAVLGDTDAQFSLGQMFEGGIGVAKNIPEAIKYYDLATSQQELRAEYSLAMLYLEGNGVQADYQKAMTLLRDAAFKGNDYAQYALARINEFGFRNSAGEVVIQPDHEQAMSMYYLAAANDFGLAEYRLAEMLTREKKTDLTLEESGKRSKLIKKLYQGAVAAGVEQANLPLAFFNAIDQNKEKEARAFEVATQEANKGSPGAALLLGLMYDRGIATPADHQLALKWYQMAAKNPVSSFILGTYSSQGHGLSKDEEKAQALLKEAADAGFSYANLNLAILKHQKGEDYLPLLQASYRGNNRLAGILLADAYLSDAKHDEQLSEARSIYQHLAELGDKNGQLKLGFMLEHGLGGEMDRVGAEKWYTQAANQGQAVAQYSLGHLYQMGYVGDQPDYDSAKKWYASAASVYAPAAVALGFIYDTVDADYKSAEKNYELAASKGDPLGELNLGLIYEKGKGRPVDLPKAQALYQQASDAGNSQAMMQMAGLYFNGVNGHRDESRALELYKKAAELGHRDALYQLGLMSETGVALKLDFNTALKYYQQAADRGNAKAMLALARIYQYGIGVARDPNKAEALYKQLAALGSAYAQYQLAMLYNDAHQGKPNAAISRKLLEEASANGSLQALRTMQWLEAQSKERLSFIEPAPVSHLDVAAERSVDLLFMDALNDWNRGDELSSRQLLDKITAQFPHYEPAKRVHEQLNRHLVTASNNG